MRTRVSKTHSLRTVFAAGLFLLACSALVPAASAHGASRGLHLHLSPDPCRAGEDVRIEIDAAKPLRSLRVGFVNMAPLKIRPEKATKKLAVLLTVPKDAKPGSLSLHAEGVLEDDTVLRAAAVLIVAKKKDSQKRESTAHTACAAEYPRQHRLFSTADLVQRSQPSAALHLRVSVRRSPCTSDGGSFGAPPSCSYS